MKQYAVDLCAIKCGRLLVEALTEADAIDIAKEMVIDGETDIDWPLFFKIDCVEEVAV
jgi:hypothetical protein